MQCTGVLLQNDITLDNNIMNIITSMLFIDVYLDSVISAWNILPLVTVISTLSNRMFVKLEHSIITRIRLLESV